MTCELVSIFEEKLERLLRDGAVGHEANDAHAGRDQEVKHLALVRVVRLQGSFSGRKSQN